MLLLDVVILVYGIVLLTPATTRLGATSGALMIAYSVVMLLDQVLLGAASGFRMWSRMATGMGQQSGSPMPVSMGWDVDMVAFAALMLPSGLIMTTRRPSPVSSSVPGHRAGVQAFSR